ncbi:hypothetical protein [Bradyrhizobium sp. AZCC 2289]|uniref:hypothetical protein n=1 Tax=Bradyrhizobium sp. AZCC 2289 TaxID=3117026 RepID=UPI002FF1FB6C
MAIRIAAVKAASLSDDKKEVIVATSGKYTGDLELRFACECLDDLVDALTRARSVQQPAPSADTAPGRSSTLATDGGGSRNPDEVRFELPKNFTITADTSGRGLVLFILNHRLEGQAGYALSPDAAKQVAGGLTKSADALLSSKKVAKS